MSHDFNDEIERVRHHYEETVSKYDKKVGFAEKVQFADGLSWVCSQVRGEALEGCKGASTVKGL